MIKRMKAAEFLTRIESRYPELFSVLDITDATDVAKIGKIIKKLDVSHLYSLVTSSKRTMSIKVLHDYIIENEEELILWRLL